MERRLYRSRENRMLFGVCGGIGDYTGIDPTVIRLGMIFIGFTCIGILFYIAAGLIIPEAPLNVRGGQGTGAGTGAGYNSGGSRPNEDAFEPVAGAKPDLQTDFKENSQTTETPAATQPSAETAESNDQTEPETKEV